MQNNEKRSTGTVEAVETAPGLIVEGYALKFGKMSEDLGGFVEVVLPGALDNTDFSDVRFLYEHDYTKILGRSTANTLSISVDETGLYFRCEFPPTTLGRDTYESIRRGDINKMSFEFEIPHGGDRVRRGENGIYIREIKEISAINELSAVSLPAYKDTDLMIATRSIKQKKEADKIILVCRLWKETINNG